MPHSVRKLLIDLSLSCEEIIDFTSTGNFKEFQGNRVLQLAVEREFEIIGEVLSRLEKIDREGLMDKIPEYRKIIDFRNIIAHGYDMINESILWDFAINRVPELLSKVREY